MAIIHKRTILRNGKSETAISVFGIAVYRRTVVEYAAQERSPIGFEAYPTEAPSFTEENDEEPEEFTSEPICHCQTPENSQPSAYSALKPMLRKYKRCFRRR